MDCRLEWHCSAFCSPRFTTAGLIRKGAESALCGPQLLPEHEARSVELAVHYLGTTSLAADANALAPLILVTSSDPEVHAMPGDRDGCAMLIGQMLGAADLLSQVSDRDYVERCYYHLYGEFVLGGLRRARTPGGVEEPLYRDALELLSRTPDFYRNYVRKRIDEDFGGVDRYLSAHFGGDDPYQAPIRSNVERCARIAAGETTLLRQEPVSTTRDLAPIYHGRTPV